ncbi:Anaphase-promoting complex subunit 1 [Microbotryomycetes sp. JL201]|nr:Anaphase-promoting complex subunit 1 [Microbotryomycetes sp. JL201]
MRGTVGHMLACNLTRVATGFHPNNSHQACLVEPRRPGSLRRMLELPIPRPPPVIGVDRASPPSAFVAAMRSRSSATASDSTCARGSPRNHQASTSANATANSGGRSAEYADEAGELSWTGKRLVWRHNGTVRKTLSFEQNIITALFASFRIERTARPREAPTEAPACSARAATALGLTTQEFTRSIAWTDEPLAVPLRPTPPIKAEPPPPLRCLVVILSDSVVVYPPHSEPLTCRLGATVSRVWPLSIGLLLELASPPQSGSEALLYMSHPFEPFQTIKGTSPASDPDGIRLERLPSSSSLLTSIIFAGALGIGEHNLVVSKDITGNKLRFWSCRSAPNQADVSVDSVIPDQSRLTNKKASDYTNEHGKRMRPQPRRRSSLPRTLVDMQQSMSRPSTNSHKMNKRQSFQAGPQPLPRLGHDVSQVFEALEEELGSAAQTTGRPGAHNHLADRRTSLSRIDLSVTMDRMALGSTSRQGQSRSIKFGSMQDPIEASTQATMNCTLLLELAVPTVLECDSATLYNVFSRQARVAIHSRSQATAWLVRLAANADNTLSAHYELEIPAQKVCAAVIRHKSIKELVVLANDSVSYFVHQDRSTRRLALHGQPNSDLGPIPHCGDSYGPLPHFETIKALRPFEAFELKLLAAMASNVSAILLSTIETNMLGLSSSIIPDTSRSRASRFIAAFNAAVFAEASLEPNTQQLSEELIAHLANRPTEPWPCHGRGLKATVDRNDAEAALWALHLMAEESRMQSDISSTAELCVLCHQLAAALGLLQWTTFYSRITGASPRLPEPSRSTTSPIFASPPPSFDMNLKDAVLGLDSPILTVAAPLGRTASLSNTIYELLDPIERYNQVWSIFSQMNPTSRSLSARAQAAVMAMHSHHWTIETVSKLPIHIRVPCHEAMRLCQLDAPAGWPLTAYEFIGRSDLAAQAAKMPPPATGLPSLDSARGKDDEQVAGLQRVMRFNEDRRVDEVARMLQTVQAVTIGGERSIDQLTPNVQQNLLFALSNRTLALPTGRALFAFCTNDGSAQLAPAHIPAINTSARLLPMPSPATLQEKEGRDGQSKSNRLTWPEFHNGVAAALELRDLDKLTSLPAWTSEDLSPKFAGVLLGLGLVRRLHMLGFNQAFELLKVKHDPTSVAILIGLAATYIGTSDPKVTSLISVHLAALHPPQSSPLSVSGTIQAAGLVGIGLLNFGSQRRSLADIMIREIESIRVIKVDDPPACREAYALSAGYACGMIMLGAGRHANAISAEVQLLQTLRQLILGDVSALSSRVSATQPQIDVSITAAPATIALAMIYLKSGRRDIADILNVPDTARELDHVRPDVLLLRTLARSLIMWDAVKPSKQWVDSCLPVFIRDATERNGKPTHSDIEIAKWNILSGACLAIGFRFAGSAAAEAHSTLIHYLDRLARAAYVKAGTIQTRMWRQAVRACLNVVSVALAMVMAGTGELNVLRRLRVAHGHFGEGVSFGVHMASHMALGLLLLGKGAYTLGTSDKAVAALLVSMYPVFPSSPSDNRTHLQALRHLWTIAIESRCLEARDVDTQEPVFLPVRLRLAEAGSTDVRTKQLVAPTLVPDLRLIRSLQVDTPRYWPFMIDFAGERASMGNSGTLWVKRKSGHLTYAQDPRGIRSIFTRSKGETGNSVIDFGETVRLLSPSVAGLRDFVRSFGGSAETRAAVGKLCWDISSGPAVSSTSSGGPSGFEAFCACVLLECLTRDKQTTIDVYLEIYKAWHTIKLRPNEPAAVLALEEIVSVLHWYSPGGPFQKAFARPSKSAQAPVPREPLLHPAFLEYLRRKCSIETRELVQNDAEAKNKLATILRNPATADTCTRGPVALYLAANMSVGSSTLHRLRALARDCVQNTIVQAMKLEQRIAILRTMMSGVREHLTRAGRPTWTVLFEEDAAGIWAEAS